MTSLSPDDFTDTNLRLIFRIVKRYWEVTGEVLTDRGFVTAMESAGWEATVRIALESIYVVLVQLKPTVGEFRWALQDVRERTAKRLTGEVIAEGMEILENGWSHPEKTRQGGKVIELSGHADARAYVAGRLHEIDRSRTAEMVPEGDIRTEGLTAMKKYLQRKSGLFIPGVLTGIRAIDQETGGFQNGEFILVVAYTGQGKSQMVTQTAWYVAFGQAHEVGKIGQNVFFATSETVRDQVMRRVWARHSRLPMFGCPAGINSQDIRDGKLSPAHEKVFHAVLNDLKTNPAYGELHIAQLPGSATNAYVSQRLREYGRRKDCALCVVDYFALLKSNIRRQTRREEFDEILNDAKSMATESFDGRGIPVLSPWSINQKSFEEAKQKRALGLASLSETSVAEKSTDMIMALLRDEDNNHELRLQFLKVRDGALPTITELEIDFRSTYLGDRAVGSLSGFTTAANAVEIGQSVLGF